MTDEGRSKRGLASVSRERRLEIASMGGKSVPRDKRAFSSDRQLAKSAGKLGAKSRYSTKEEV
jgi:general stress protein YciG